MRRAVAVAAARLPSWPARGDVERGEHSSESDDHHIVGHDGRAREAPDGKRRAGRRRGVTGPDDASALRVERIQNARGAETVDTAAVEGWGRPRAGASVRLVEARRVLVHPHGLTGADPVGADDLVLPSLLLRVEDVAGDGERRPAGADRPTPERDRRRGAPIGSDPYSGDDAIAVRTAEARPADRDRRSRWCRRGGGLGGVGIEAGFDGEVRSRRGRWQVRRRDDRRPLSRAVAVPASPPIANGTRQSRRH